VSGHQTDSDNFTFVTLLIDYLSVLSSMNQSRVLASQVAATVRTGQHKYLAHEMAILYVRHCQHSG
jgi:hypothetical protein